MKKFLLILCVLLPLVAQAQQPTIEVRRGTGTGGVSTNDFNTFSNYVATNFATSNQFAVYTNIALTNFATSNQLWITSNYVQTNFATSNQVLVLSNYVQTNFASSNQVLVLSNYFQTNAVLSNAWFTYTNTTVAHLVADTGITLVTNANGASITISSTGGGVTFNANQFNNQNGQTNIISGVPLTNVAGYGTYTLSNVHVTNYVRQTRRTVTYTDATNVIINMNDGNAFYVLLTNTCHLIISNMPAAGIDQTINIQLQQDATGARAVTFATNTIFFPSGVSPTITTNAGRYDVITGIASQSGTNILATYAQDFR